MHRHRRMHCRSASLPSGYGAQALAPAALASLTPRPIPAAPATEYICLVDTEALVTRPILETAMDLRARTH